MSLTPEEPTVTEEDLSVFTAYERELWEERSAIMEYDAHLSRDDAERNAFDDVILSRHDM